MIHEGVAQAIAQINEDRRYNTTDPKLRDTVVRALRLAKRINRMHGQKVPVLHILDNGIQAGRTIDQMLGRKMGNSNQEVSVTVGTPPWWGKYILIGHGPLKSYYPADAYTRHDQAGRLVPTEEAPKGKTHWDEGTAVESAITWTHLIHPPEDKAAAAAAREHGLESSTDKDLESLHPGARKEASDRITPKSSQQHMVKTAQQWLDSIAREAEESLSEDDGEEDRQEVAEIIQDTKKAKERVLRAAQAGSLTYQGLVKLFTEDFGRMIDDQGRMM